jgi:hypothetical protein
MDQKDKQIETGETATAQYQPVSRANSNKVASVAGESPRQPANTMTVPAKLYQTIKNHRYGREDLRVRPAEECKLEEESESVIYLIYLYR